ncbi:MAG TPA: ATP-binding cassette domain-containing protein, partial [Thermoanaerobaculia bacterium]|nr:ATP-binding cassette domain-containing protein [Thermoanaerobaculia bacterium]
MLEVAGVDVFYGNVQALWDVSFRVGAGEIVTLIGANGAGKSTMLRAISGLLAPRSGRILFEGEPIAGLSAHRIAARGLVLVPEARQ